MENHLGVIPTENILHPRTVQSIRHQRNNRPGIAVLIEFLFNEKEGGFALLYQQEPAGIQRNNLPAQF
jgi:hypothetical protein